MQRALGRGLGIAVVSRLADALKRRFASPEAALRHLGLDASLLEGTNMSNLSRTAALAAVAALKRRGLIAQDASNEEAERVIHNATETGDRTMTARRDARDVRRTRDEMTEEERRHPDAARDALRRAGDATEIDDDTIGELLETLAQTHPEVVGQMAREVGQDGPRRWARDRREMRVSRDRMLTSRARKFGRVGRDDPEPFAGMPMPGGEMVRDDENVGYRPDRSWPENGGRDGINVSERSMDRRRGRAFDLAMDTGTTQDAFASWLPGAASINKV